VKYWREVAVVVALALAVLCFKAWLENHDAVLLARAERAQIIADRDAKVEEIEKLRKEIRDPKVIIREIPKYVPFHIESNVGSLPSGNAEDPAIPPEIKIVGNEIPKLWDYVQKCRECEVKLAAAEKEINNLEKLKTRPWHKSPKLWFTIGVLGGAAAAGAAQ
jgi:hypothetical protein